MHQARSALRPIWELIELSGRSLPLFSVLDSLMWRWNVKPEVRDGRTVSWWQPVFRLARSLYRASCWETSELVNLKLPAPLRNLESQKQSLKFWSAKWSIQKKTPCCQVIQRWSKMFFVLSPKQSSFYPLICEGITIDLEAKTISVKSSDDSRGSTGLISLNVATAARNVLQCFPRTCTQALVWIY